MRADTSSRFASVDASMMRAGMPTAVAPAGDDPVAQAMKGLIDNAAGHEHQIALLWAAIEKLSTSKTEECVPDEAQTTEHFDADHLKQLMR